MPSLTDIFAVIDIYLRCVPYWEEKDELNQTHNYLKFFEHHVSGGGVVQL